MKYTLKINKNLKNILSVFKQEGKIPLINLYENELKYENVDASTRVKIKKLEILLMPDKQNKKKKQKKQKKVYDNPEEERLNKMRVVELRQLIKDRGIKGYLSGRNSKKEIIEKLMNTID
jgi:hypothetical protein